MDDFRLISLRQEMVRLTQEIIVMRDVIRTNTTLDFIVSKHLLKKQMNNHGNNDNIGNSDNKSGNHNNNISNSNSNKK